MERRKRNNITFKQTEKCFYESVMACCALKREIIPGPKWDFSMTVH